MLSVAIIKKIRKDETGYFFLGSNKGAANTASSPAKIVTIFTKSSKGEIRKVANMPMNPKIIKSMLETSFTVSSFAPYATTLKARNMIKTTVAMTPVSVSPDAEPRKASRTARIPAMIQELILLSDLWTLTLVFPYHAS
jgi:hypothetical protein